MSTHRSFRGIRKATRKDELFDTLRREILAARLKVTLDEQLDRPTSATVKRLAGMTLPPAVRFVDDERGLLRGRTMDRTNIESKAS